jgi:hypothetical protein
MTTELDASTFPKQMRAENKTLSAFWDIEDVKAHCLLDSGCEGVMISLEFTRATGMRTFELEHLIGLQLACIGSKSTINYGVGKFDRRLSAADFLLSRLVTLYL